MARKPKIPKERTVSRKIACLWCGATESMKFDLTIERNGVRVHARCARCRNKEIVSDGWAAERRAGKLALHILAMALENRLGLRTVIGVNDPAATRAWARTLHEEATKPSMFEWLKPALAYSKVPKKRRR